MEIRAFARFQREPGRCQDISVLLRERWNSECPQGPSLPTVSQRHRSPTWSRTAEIEDGRILVPAQTGAVIKNKTKCVLEEYSSGFSRVSEGSIFHMPEKWHVIEVTWWREQKQSPHQMLWHRNHLSVRFDKHATGTSADNTKSELFASHDSRQRQAQLC